MSSIELNSNGWLQGIVSFVVLQLTYILPVLLSLQTLPHASHTEKAEMSVCRPRMTHQNSTK